MALWRLTRSVQHRSQRFTCINLLKDITALGSRCPSHPLSTEASPRSGSWRPMRPDPNMRAAAHILRLVPTPSRKGPREAAPAAERGQGSLRRRGKLGVRSGTPVRSSRLGEVPDPAATPPGSSISHRGPHRQGTAAERRAHGADRTAAHAHTRAHARPLPRMKPKAWKVPAGLKAVGSRRGRGRRVRGGLQLRCPSQLSPRCRPTQQLPGPGPQQGQLAAGSRAVEGARRGRLKEGAWRAEGRGDPSAQLPEPLSPGSRRRSVLSPPGSFSAQEPVRSSRSPPLLRPGGWLGP